MAEETRTDEDKIIEILKIEGMVRQYEDLDFLPVRQSLYEVEDEPPVYDEFVGPQIVWCRPQEIDIGCAYFDDDFVAPRVSAGSLPDETFISALMALCAFPGYDLLENVIASRPEDFKTFGVISCRFYVEGEWVEVITDTRLPCVRNNLTLQNTPAYSKSTSVSEMWVTLLEKAYAKAVGSYEAIQKIKLHEALLHLTGGSVKEYSTADGLEGAPQLWPTLINIFSETDVLVLAQPIQGDEWAPGDPSVSAPGGDGKEEEAITPTARPTSPSPPGSPVGSPNSPAGKGVQGPQQQIDLTPARTYVVSSFLEMSTFHLVCVFDPWRELGWTGAWGNDSGKWDDFPEVLRAAEEDPRVHWRRENPDSGYVWMGIGDFQQIFGKLTACKLFPNEKYKYYRLVDEWLAPEERLTGPLVTIQDKAAAVRQAAEARTASAVKSTAAYSIDADASWFNNPQARIYSKVHTTCCVSVVPIVGEGDAAPVPSITIAATPLTANQSHIWDAATCKVTATDKTSRGLSLVKGQEATIWRLDLDPEMAYHIIPSCNSRRSYGPFVVRIFSPDFISIESMPPLLCTRLEGAWKRSTTQDTAGGPPALSDKEAKDGLKPNPRWSQNPQFHVNLRDKFSRKDVHLKMVVRRLDKPAKVSKGAAPEVLSFVVCKADCLEDSQPLRKKGGGARQNALGEVIPAKESSLRRKKRNASAEQAPTQASRESGKTILRRTEPPRDAFAISTSGASRTEASVYFPLLPRSWCANGLLLVPSLSETGFKGDFAVEVYSSEPVDVAEMPEQFMKSVASEWTEALCGGSHICENFRKNPRFILKLLTTDVTRQPIRMRITLTRYGDAWTPQCRHDAVGCMIGFYVFRTNMGQQEMVYEGAFVPDNEVSSESNFALEPLDENEDYIILASTFSEGKTGSFVLNIMADCEVALTKGDTGR